MVQYRGKLMPLVRDRSRAITCGKDGRQPVLVFADHDRSMGLVVDEIVDIVEDQLEIELVGRPAGPLGSAVIAGKATDVIDTGYCLTQAFSDWFARAGDGELGAKTSASACCWSTTAPSSATC